jgi:phage terminase small subunit
LAYRAVYPSIKSDDVAGAAAARLLGNVRVQARIAEIMRAGAERAEVTVEQVVRELKLIGFSDIRKVVSWRNELVTRTEKGKDGEPVMVLMPRVTIVDADKISDEAAAAVAEVSQTVNGALRVKLHDKHRAVDRPQGAVGCWWSLLGGRKTHVPHEAARVHHAARRGGGVAAGGAGAAAGDASDWVSAQHVVSRLGAPPGGSLLSALTQSESGDCLRLLVCLGAT